MHDIQVEFVPKLKFVKEIQSRHQTLKNFKMRLLNSRINYADQRRDPPTSWFVKIMLVTPKTLFFVAWL